MLVPKKCNFPIISFPPPGTTSQMWAITGCSTPTLDDPGCGVNGPQETRFHVSVEGWTLGYALTWEKIQSDYPSTAPINLGNMGYDGAAGQYVSANLVDETYDTTGIALDFYRSYDSRFRNVSEYFDPIIAFNTSDFQTCEESRFSNVAMMQTYLEVTGDLDGVETVNGKLRAKCFSGHFWLPPSCRQDVSRCLVFITVDPGYDLATMMQRATIWKMPVVPAVVKEKPPSRPKRNEFRQNLGYLQVVPGQAGAEVSEEKRTI